jgi:serine/threonine-protein kinase
MALDRMVMSRAPDSKAGSRGGRTTTIGLPDALLAEQVNRLALLCAVVGVFWALALGLLLVFAPVLDPRARVLHTITDVSGVVLSACMFAYVRFGLAPPATKVSAGLGFLILNAIGLAIIDTWVAPPAGSQMNYVSPIAVATLIYAVIAPAAPRQMLTAAFVAAMMDPLAWALAAVIGRPVVSFAEAVVYAVPTFMCAAVVALPARTMQRLGSGMREVQELGSYRLMTLLGHGAMGEVWEARHRLLVRRAAIKLVRLDRIGARDEAEIVATLRRFEREVNATAELGSPHTINVFDFGVTDEGTFYYVMELLIGRDLETLVHDFGPVPADRVVYVIDQVCHSLADAHARGLVHRDIKPANIYVCRMGIEYDFVKVLDFGLVMVRHENPPDALEDEGTTAGTPAYMSPEAIRGDESIDGRADIYSLGCVMYYLLTGQIVFEARTSKEMFAHHLDTIPMPPSLRSELPVPPELDALVMACLEKDPDKRPQSAVDVAMLACGAIQSGGWSERKATAWWESHLPELTVLPPVSTVQT